VELTPFRIAVPEADIADLHRRLDRTRWPDQGPPAAHEHRVTPIAQANGIPVEAVTAIVDHWRHRYDWRALEARLNRYEQWMATGDEGDDLAAGVRLHLLHAPSPEPDAVPLVLTHGWPGSIVEFLDVIEPLRDPRAHGGDPATAFHVIVPSIPGYGFSGPTTRAGVDTSACAAAIAAAVGALGYDRFVAQGGDWGAVITRRLGEAHAAVDGGPGVMAIHTNMLFAMPDADDADSMAGVTDDDLARFGAAVERIADGTGYMALQSTKPDALTPGLVDSPAALAAWILEKFHVWSDLDRLDLSGADAGAPGQVVAELQSAFTLDRLLDNVSVYWFTATAGSAARLYAEANRHGNSAISPWKGRVQVPTGHGVYPMELLQTPRAWADRRYPIVHWCTQPRGGHFAAMERPALFVEDLQQFRRALAAR
jgi:pimeloyl-ACP methyl ester carboxylesterase